MTYYTKAKCLTSAPDIQHLDESRGVEVAFAGRSNAGKSSALNTLTRQKGLARTSKTPGRTQLINVFELDHDRRLVDLPGYGFAKVPLAMKIKWQKALGEYLQKRECIAGLVVLMDIRHPFKDLDQELIQWAVNAKIPVLALLTKADKLKRGAAQNTLLAVRKELSEQQSIAGVELFSSLKKTGVDKVYSYLDTWLIPDENDDIAEPEESDPEEDAQN